MKPQSSRIQSAEIRFLLWVAGYHLTDTKRKNEIRKKLAMLNHNEKINEYRKHEKYLIERMSHTEISKIKYEGRGKRNIGRPKNDGKNNLLESEINQIWFKPCF